mmetsp:Transcript_14342/g.14324  ORF Transcript_14342/g.14324 Transcript_14342/m.14324 type:complete len:119 (-) Transcript_14342:500-856(-)
MLTSLTGGSGIESFHKFLIDLDVEMDTIEEMPFLICPLNRYSEDRYLFRSPWSSEFFPEKNKGDDFKEFFGEAYNELSTLENRANEIFNFYGELYYAGEEGLTTSVYIMDYEKDELIE